MLLLKEEKKKCCKCYFFPLSHLENLQLANNLVYKTLLLGTATEIYKDNITRWRECWVQGQEMTLGQSHTLFFSLVSHRCKMGLTPSLLQEQRATMESVRGYDGDHPSSEGVCQAEPPTQAWSVHELQDTGHLIQPHQRILRVPEGTKKERRAMTSPSLTTAGCSPELHCQL